MLKRSVFFVEAYAFVYPLRRYVFFIYDNRTDKTVYREKSKYWEKEHGAHGMRTNNSVVMCVESNKSKLNCDRSNFIPQLAPSCHHLRLHISLLFGVIAWINFVLETDVCSKKFHVYTVNRSMNAASVQLTLQRWFENFSIKNGNDTIGSPHLYGIFHLLRIFSMFHVNPNKIICEICFLYIPYIHDL